MPGAGGQVARPLPGTQPRPAPARGRPDELPEGVERVEARSVLTRSRVPGMDYAINPYFGCGFGCSYCYAIFMCRYQDRDPSTWGSFVRAKVNAPELLGRELRRKGRRDASIFLSSVTDPYQPAEASLGLTRACLEQLVRAGHRGRVMVMTKSPRVTRDLDLLEQLDADIGLSVAPLDDEMGPFLEPDTPSLASRLDALAELARAGMRTYAFVGPLFPHLERDPDALHRLFADVRDAGTEEVFVAWFNLRPDARRRLLDLVRGADPDLIRRYYTRPSSGPKRRMEPVVWEALRRTGLRMKTRGVIDH